MRRVSRITPEIAATLSDEELIYLKSHEACEMQAAQMVEEPDQALEVDALAVCYILERAYGDVKVARRIARKVAWLKRGA